MFLTGSGQSAGDHPLSAPSSSPAPLAVPGLGSKVLHLPRLFSALTWAAATAGVSCSLGNPVRGPPCGQPSSQLRPVSVVLFVCGVSCDKDRKSCSHLGRCPFVLLRVGPSRFSFRVLAVRGSQNPGLIFNLAFSKLSHEKETHWELLST